MSSSSALTVVGGGGGGNSGGSEGKGGKGASWRNYIVEPTEYTPNPALLNTADIDLELDWVNGYRARDCRNNIDYAAGGQIVYFAASLGIVYDKNTDAQRFYTGDGVGSQDIVAMAMHPNGKICATGALGYRPKIVIWDVDSLATLATLQGFHSSGVNHLAFSPDGSKVACGANDGICDDPRNFCSSAATCHSRDNGARWARAQGATRRAGRGGSPDRSAARAQPGCPTPAARPRRTCAPAATGAPSCRR